MAWVTPLTWVVDQIVNAANLNEQIKDNMNETAPGKAAAAGDVFYATAANAIAARPKGLAGQSLIMNAGATAPIWGAPTHLNELRLTLTTVTPVTTSDVTGATTIYLTPYVGNRIALFDGTDWIQLESAEVSVAVPAPVSRPFDIFAYDVAGVLTLETHTWVNDTTRTTELVYLDGVLVKSGQTSRRYIGTGRTTGVSGEIEDSEATRFLWNYYNRVPRFLYCTDPTNTWTYTTETIRAANNNTTVGVGRFELVIGVAEALLKAENFAFASNSSNPNVGAGIGIDSTSSNSSQIMGGSIAAGTFAHLWSKYSGYPVVGYHFIQRTEVSSATGTTTWRGDDGIPTYKNSGMLGSLEG